jgi:hypothetical protein
LHLFGILFPHIKDDMQSKSHQIGVGIDQILTFLT